MTSKITTASKRSRSAPAPARRFGYLVAIAINVWFLWLVNQFPIWEWPRFLTDQFEEVLPIVTASILAGIIVNAMFFLYDPSWFKALGNMITAGFGFAVAWRMFQVFPFDFATYSVNWSWLARLVLMIAMIGTAVGFIVESVKLVVDPLRRG